MFNSFFRICSISSTAKLTSFSFSQSMTLFDIVLTQEILWLAEGVLASSIRKKMMLQPIVTWHVCLCLYACMTVCVHVYIWMHMWLPFVPELRGQMPLCAQWLECQIILWTWSHIKKGTAAHSTFCCDWLENDVCENTEKKNRHSHGEIDRLIAP